MNLMDVLLVMSDDLEARVATVLLGQLGLHVARARTIAEATTYLAGHACTAIILHTQLADGDSYDFLTLLRTQHFEGSIIVLSSSTDVKDKVRALEEGATDYIVCPYEPAEFCARVKVALRQVRRYIAQGNNAVVRVGSVELNLNTAMVSVEGQPPKHLTPNEMRLLHYLMTHTQRVVHSEELLVQMFGPNYHAASPGAVSVYIRRLREKLEDDVNQPRYILTVRRGGYRFNPYSAQTSDAV